MPTKTRKLDERELYDTKWFDYYHLPPDVATLTFFFEWAKAITNFKESIGESRFVNVLKKYERLDIEYLKSHGTTWKHVQNLRQWADQHGLEYRNYWSVAFIVATDLNFVRVLKTKTAKHSTVFLSAFYNKNLKREVLRRIKEHRSQVIQKSDFWLFRAKHYKGYQSQRNYYNYLIEMVKQRYPTQIVDKVKIMVENKEISMSYFKDLR